jgi:arylsulfatase A-like enzyme
MAQQPTNILFIIADDASHFGATGCTWTKTPHIDRLAQRGLVFDSAYTPTAKCAPSRAAILTGRNPWQLEEAGNHQPYFPAKFKVFTEAMSEAGIHVGQLYYIHNFAPDRWPCGNPELDLLDTDKGPTKKLIEDLGQGNRCWELSFGKRPAEELFDLATDPDCLKNLAADPAWKAKAAALREQLFAELKRQNDPRILGQGDVFDRYPTAKGKK